MNQKEDERQNALIKKLEDEKRLQLNLITELQKNNRQQQQQILAIQERLGLSIQNND